MANKDLQFDSHIVTHKGKARDDVSIYELPEGLWIYFIEKNEVCEVTLTWSRIRAALKRKDKK